jgi:hypothetical protein
MMVSTDTITANADINLANVICMKTGNVVNIGLTACFKSENNFEAATLYTIGTIPKGFRPVFTTECITAASDGTTNSRGYARV